mgnify:FL=1
MDILSANRISTELAVYIKKDYKHTLAIGILVCAIFAAVLFFSNNSSFKEQAPIIFLMIILFFGGRALYEMKQAFYLINATQLKVEVVEREIDETKEIRYYLYSQENHLFACSYDYCELIIAKPTFPKAFLINTPLYNLVQQHKDVVMLLSSTNTLLGCYTKQTGFVAN